MARVQDEEKVLSKVMEVKEFLFHLRRLLMDGERFEGKPLATMLHTPRRILETHFDDCEEAQEGLGQAIGKLGDFQRFLLNYPEAEIPKVLLDRPLFDAQYVLEDVAQQLKDDLFKKVCQKNDDDEP